MIYKKEFERLLSELITRKSDLTEELKRLPETELICYTSHGQNCFSERLPKVGNIKKERRKGIKKDPEKLYSLARKKYVKEAIALLDGNIKLIQDMLKNYLASDEESVMADIAGKYPEIAPGIYYGTDDSNIWKDAISVENNFFEDGLKSLAADGTRRRSLGELLIGSRLSHYGIPYVYEASLPHPDLKDRFSPDFTIKRPRDGKIIYWEHIGKVNDEAYLEYNRYKLGEYEKYGIVPWDNLIISYSRADNGINEKLIDSLIHGWLL